MRQPRRSNRKPPVFLRCPVCGTEFRQIADQRWCSVDCARAARRQARSETPKRQIAAKNRP
jgi:hypothetical protein